MKASIYSFAWTFVRGTGITYGTAHKLPFDIPKARILNRHPSLMLSCADLEHGGSKPKPLESTFNAKNFTRKLSIVILAQFALEMCFGAQNRQKMHKKTSILMFKVIQSHCSRWRPKARV